MSQEILDTPLSEVLKLIYPVNDKRVHEEKRLYLLFFQERFHASFLLEHISRNINTLGSIHKNIKNMHTNEKNTLKDICIHFEDSIKLTGFLIMHLYGVSVLECYLNKNKSDHCDINAWFKDLKSLKEGTFYIEG